MRVEECEWDRKIESNRNTAKEKGKCKGGLGKSDYQKSYFSNGYGKGSNNHDEGKVKGSFLGVWGRNLDGHEVLWTLFSLRKLPVKKNVANEVLNEIPPELVGSFQHQGADE